MKKRWITALVLTALAGTGLHFAYGICPEPLVGLFAPVNESVWEHLKLLFWPFLAAGFALTRREEDQAAAWSGLLLAELVMPLFLVGMYYLLRAGFGVRSLGVGRAAGERERAAGVFVGRAGYSDGAFGRGADLVYAGSAGAAHLCG